jgi:hypothetical protein
MAYEIEDASLMAPVERLEGVLITFLIKLHQLLVTLVVW